MEEKELTHQTSMIQDSFSTIERLENEMANITREFDSLNNANSEQEQEQETQKDDSV
ncbi:MAG: hypothetical protein U0R17_04040 [Acidimicrobiia bacterium]